MPAVEKRTISLPSDQAAFIDAKVSAGDYASTSEVVRAGLRALKDATRRLNAGCAMKSPPAMTR